MVLREAGKLDVIRHEAARLMFSPDIPVGTQKLRKSFDLVKQSLGTRGMKYSLLFSTRLQVQDGEMIRFFTLQAVD